MFFNESNSLKNDAYAVLKYPEFVFFIIARFFLTLSSHMQSLIVGWQIYAITHDALYLGLIGLAEVIPSVGIALFAGHFADRFNRKKIILFSILAFSIGSALLLYIAFNQSLFIAHYGTLPIYIAIFVTGIARGFVYPALMSMMSQLVPKSLYGNSSTWNSIFWHIAAVVGPSLGGLVYGFAGILWAYSCVLIFAVISFLLFIPIKNKPILNPIKGESIFESLRTGIRFVFSKQVVWGAMALDMFAVLFGGAIALLPIFADTVLHIGVQGLGFLRAAPLLGAVAMSFYLAHYPPLKRAGHNMLISIVGFGLCMIGFALSKNVYLTFGLLALSGMFDNVSVVIRQTIMQVFTPDNMRGRVAAVNSIFINSSNEFGSFESGAAAKLLGLIPSVIFGGSITLIVAAITAKTAPLLTKLNLAKALKENSES